MHVCMYMHVHLLQVVCMYTQHALLPVCIQYITQGESPVVNVAGEEVEYCICICHKTLTKQHYIFRINKTQQSALLYLHLLIA